MTLLFNERERRRCVHACVCLTLLMLCWAGVETRAQEAAVATDEVLRYSLRQDVAGSPLRGDESRLFGLPETGSTPHRSPLLAAGLSLLVPGAGEVYAESYLLAGLFLGAEITGWYFARSYDIKGDDQTALFQAYADSHWSTVKYAEWLNANAKTFPGGENTAAIDINPDDRLPHWERVNWAQMNEVEMAVPVFSHRLPPHGHQQYFELIGKYDQYSFGWEDKKDGYYREISPRFREYSLMRGDANDFYTTSERIVNLIILNHVLSAIDAAWAAVRFNKVAALHTGVGIHVLPSGEAAFIPGATFTVGL